MRRHLRKHGVAYLFAIAAVAAAVLLRLHLARWFSTDAPLLISVGAVLAAAWFGGFAPGIVTTLLTAGSLVVLALVPHAVLLGAADNSTRVTLFIAVGLTVSVISETARRYRRRLEAAQNRMQRQLRRRKEYEEKIDRLNKQLRLVTDCAPVLLAYWDTNLRYKFVNKRYAARFGLQPRDLIGRPISELLGPEAYALVEPYVQKVMRGERVECELELPYRELGWRWMRAACEPEIDATGRTVGCLAAITDITSHKEAEADLRASQERLALTQQAIGIGTFEWDLRTDKVEWSATLEALYGYPAGGFGRTLQAWKARIHPDDCAHMHATVERARREIVDLREEFRIVRVDENVRWVAALAKVFADGEGRPARMVGVNLDITEHKRADEVLRERERMLAQSQQMAHVGGWELDLNDMPMPTQNMLRWTDETYRIFGFAPGSIDVTPELFMSRVHPDDRGKIVDAVAQALREKAPYELEHRIIRPDGAERIIHEWVTIQLAPEGRVLRLLGTAQDITEQRRMEEQVRASERQFRLLADAMPQIAWVTDAFGRVIYVNQRWCDYTGLAPEQSQSDSHLASIVHPDDIAPMMEAWSRCLATGADYEQQLRFKRAADGAYRWFLSRGVAVRDEQGRVARWFGTATDIEDQKRAEEALRESDRRKDEFLATLAHELRNPLAPIQHGLQVMRMPNANLGMREQARLMMERQTAQMVRLIDDLLDVSRISRNTLELRKEWVDLGAIVQTAVETSRPLVEAAGHTLTVELPSERILLNADVTRLAQVFANLLNNAVKYTCFGGRITITAEQRADEVSVAVKDNGIGIARDKLDAIFDMFVQLDRSLEAARGGLGIGLTLTKRLVEMHGGRIEARSDGPGTGSEFVVHLPTVLLPVDTVPCPALDVDICADAPSLSILVVDDNQDSADSLAALLRLMGHRARTARDGVEAIEVAESFRPDVVLLDIGMPRMNGYETARHLRGRPWGKELLLVALTGWGQESDKRRARDAGFDHHVTKPIDPTLLTRLLAERARVPAGA
ncbi:MAG: PAS domain-containing protein [Sulfurifustis sp.]